MLLRTFSESLVSSSQGGAHVSKEVLYIPGPGRHPPSLGILAGTQTREALCEAVGCPQGSQRRLAGSNKDSLCGGGCHLPGLKCNFLL